MYKATLAMFVCLLTATPNFAAEFFILPGTKTLLMMGETLPSDVSTLRGYLKNDKVKGLILKGPGGDLEAGYSIASEVLKNKLDVLIPENTECASACSLIFAAGKNRTMEPGSKLGFHLPFVKLESGDEHRFCTQLVGSIEGKICNNNNGLRLCGVGFGVSPKCLELVYQMGLKDIRKLSKYLERDGISPEVLNFVINTPSEKMRWLAPIEARSLGLVNQPLTR